MLYRDSSRSAGSDWMQDVQECAGTMPARVEPGRTWSTAVARPRPATTRPTLVQMGSGQGPRPGVTNLSYYSILYYCTLSILLVYYLNVCRFDQFAYLPTQQTGLWSIIEHLEQVTTVFICLCVTLAGIRVAGPRLASHTGNAICAPVPARRPPRPWGMGCGSVGHTLGGGLGTVCVHTH